MRRSRRKVGFVRDEMKAGPWTALQIRSACPRILQRGRSEGELEPEFNRSRRAQRKDARSYANANGRSISIGGAVDRAGSTGENSAQDIPWNIEVGEVEQIIETDAWLNRELPVFDIHGPVPSEAGIESLQPGESNFALWS